jgi:polyisoprenyl-teichoic acid--peptidoglycan teichoic acid transferase
MAIKPPSRPLKTGSDRPRRYNSYVPGADSKVRSPDAPPPTSRGYRRIIGRIIIFLLLAVIALFILVGVWDARNLSAASHNLFGTGNILNLLSTSGAQTDASGRMNILLIGYSIDDPGHPAASLTDSIILLSMNRATDSGYMLSIPRDLYVDIPGFGYGKINEAYNDGGVLLLEKIVSRDLQTQINYYALIDYAAVKDTVNSLGGITVNINSTDPRGLFDPNISPADGGPLKLGNGPQTIDGQTALNLTRARGDPCDCGQLAYGFAQSDFDRTQHQRQVLTAIKDKLNWKVVLLPWKNQRILNAVSSNVKTDIPATAVRSVFGAFNSIPGAKLQSVSLRNLGGHNYLSSYQTIYGQDALVPAAGLSDYSDIDNAVSALNQ